MAGSSATGRAEGDHILSEGEAANPGNCGEHDQLRVSQLQGGGSWLCYFYLPIFFSSNLVFSFNIHMVE